MGDGGSSRQDPEVPTLEELAPLFPELELEELIGRGGMGAVYLATQSALGRKVALKVLLGDLSSAPSFARRFEREARTLASLSHPGCVVIHDFGERDGFFFLLMEYVDGANLRQLLETREVAPREALSIVSRICDGLQYAHDAGVVHRDIKPENIIVTRDGRVKILDYGLAKLIDPTREDSHLTGTFQAMGSVHYMAPEQWKKPLEVDHRADIYSLGVVFYELLTGELPVGRFPLPSQKVEVDVRLDEVVLKALEIEPERRWQHASDVKTQMQGLGEPPPRRSTAATERQTEKKRGIPGWAIALIVLLLALPMLGLILLIPVSLLGVQTNDLSGTISGSEVIELEARLEQAPEDLFEYPDAGGAPLPMPTVILDAAEIEEPREQYLLTPHRFTELRITPGQAVQLEPVLRATLLFQRQYESDAVLHSERPWPGHLHVELDAFAEKFASLKEKLEAKARFFTDGILGADELIEAFASEGLLARGSVPVEIYLQRWESGYRAVEIPADGSGDAVRSSGDVLPARFHHLWDLPGNESNGLPPEAHVRRGNFPRTIEGDSVWLEDDLLRLGLSAEEAAGIASVVGEARDRYLALEAEHSTVTWNEEGHLIVSIEPFFSGEESYAETTWRAVRDKVSEFSRLPVVKDHLELSKVLTRGGEAEEFELWLERDRLIYLRNQGDRTRRQTSRVVDGEVPLDSPYRRFWQRGQELVGETR
jgi:serine/threonine protein kinase